MPTILLKRSNLQAMVYLLVQWPETQNHTHTTVLKNVKQPERVMLDVLEIISLIWKYRYAYLPCCTQRNTPTANEHRIIHILIPSCSNSHLKNNNGGREM